MLLVDKPGAPNDRGCSFTGFHIASSEGPVENKHATRGSEATYHLCRCKATDCNVKTASKKDLIHIDRWRVVTEPMMRSVRSKWKASGNEYKHLEELGLEPGDSSGEDEDTGVCWYW